MSKIICDVCGTTYPETAAQCPICGCAKNTTQQTAAGDQAPGEAGYTYVKGGRFSKSNVRKRYQPGREPERRVAKAPQQKNEGSNTNRILAVIIVLLLLAIAAVLIYMGVRVFFPNLGQSGSNSTEGNQTTQVTENTTPSENNEIPCTGLSLSKTTVDFIKAGDGYLLSATPVPANTTDEITFVSSDETVATVSSSGMINAVAGGQATITVTCGDQTEECKVVCNFGDVTIPTESTEATVAPPDGYVLALKYKEFTMSDQYPNPVGIFKGNDMGVKASDITWTSDDPKIASVDENGVVSAVGKGYTTVRASYGGQTASCKVIVAFTPKASEPDKYILSHTDVTLYVNDPAWNSFRISLMVNDETKANVEAEWTVSDEGYVDINNRNVKAVKVTSDLPKQCVTITATVEGETYTCIVRVVEKAEEE